MEQRFIKSQELGYARLNEGKVQMREEKEVFHRQRAEILNDGIFHPTVEEKLLFITILVAINSPLWLTVVFIYNICSRTRARYRRDYWNLTDRNLLRYTTYLISMLGSALEAICELHQFPGLQRLAEYHKRLPVTRR